MCNIILSSSRKLVRQSHESELTFEEVFTRFGYIASGFLYTYTLLILSSYPINGEYNEIIPVYSCTYVSIRV